MEGHQAHLCKRLSTVILQADKRTFPGVQPSMIVEVCDLRKCLSTIQANVWPFVPVNPFMVPQIRRLSEAFSAIFAYVFPFSAMVSDVVHQSGFFREASTAERTETQPLKEIVLKVDERFNSLILWM